MNDLIQGMKRGGDTKCFEKMHELINYVIKNKVNHN